MAAANGATEQIVEVSKSYRISDRDSAQLQKLAAEHGNSEAAFLFGMRLATGSGVRENDREAIQRFASSATAGNHSAQYNLAEMYKEGEGTKQDIISAYVWYSMATLGVVTASVESNKILASLLPSQVAEAQSRATRCFESGYKDCD